METKGISKRLGGRFTSKPTDEKELRRFEAHTYFPEGHPATRYHKD